jgi:hypothetical protein
MKTEEYLILGVMGYLAYKQIKGDISEAVENLNPFARGSGLPNLDFSNMFGAINYPAFDFSSIFAGLNLNPEPNPSYETRMAALEAAQAARDAKKQFEKDGGLPPILDINLPGYENKTYVLPSPYDTTEAKFFRGGATTGLTYTGVSAMDAARKNAVAGLGPMGQSFKFVKFGVASAPIYDTAKTSDAGTTVYQRTAAQQAYVDARTHLGSPIGTPAPQALYTPDYIAKLPKDEASANGGPYQTNMGYNVGSIERSKYNPSF